MTSNYGMNIMVGLCAAVLTLAALQAGSSVAAPVAFAFFIIAIVWPIQRALEMVSPKLLALLGTALVTVIVTFAMASMVAWSFGRAIQWLVSNAARFQELYMAAVGWLEQRNILVASMAMEHFNIRWLLGVINQLKAHISGLTTFTVVTSIYVLLGLLEIDAAAERLRAIRDGRAGPDLIRVCSEIGAKIRRYMYVRSVMSVMTGLVIWVFALAAGLELATAWGAIAFVLNYIPFIGPLIATIFPTLFALVQTESWQFALVIFVGLNVIQFLIGSYFEPRMAGAQLAMSPFLVMLAIFFWTYLWGLPGTLVGVPVVIAILTLCEQYPSCRWVSVMSGKGKEEGG